MSKLSLGIQSLCTGKEHKYKEKKSTKIKQVSSKNKNVAAKFSKETQAAILIRDKHCIICSKGITDIHHCYFGTQAMYGEDRNDIQYGVGLCRDCHNEVHGCKQGEGIRQQTINYLKELYER